MVSPLPHLTALLAQLDDLANDAWRAGDEHQERYYYGVMFGLETARERLAQLVADMMRETTDQPRPKN
jgi:hypothetical protein